MYFDGSDMNLKELLALKKKKIRLAMLKTVLALFDSWGDFSKLVERRQGNISSADMQKMNGENGGNIE